MQKYDLIIFDAVGMPYTGTTYRFGGLGGSEFETILLAEALAEKKYKVAIVNNFRFPCTEYGVDYWPTDYLSNNTLDCKTLLVMRSSPVPVGRIEFENLRFWFTDMPDESQFGQLANWLAPGRYAQGICVSSWHRSLFPPTWNFTYIHNMIPDWVYDLSPKEKNLNKYIYASAAIKGLDPTIEVWRELKKNYQLKKAELNVCHPGYDKIDVKKLQENKINFLGSLPFKELVEQLRTTQHMFYANSFPETFCIVGVLAEIFGVTPNILIVQHPGALPEVLANTSFVTHEYDKFQKNIFGHIKTPPILKKAKDYRISTILPRWIKELKL